MGGSADVAVVIVNYRTKVLTTEATRSVLTEPEVAEVTVVDNGSGDGSLEHLRSQLGGLSPPVTVVASEHNLGFGRGCNLGVRRSSAPFLFLLNSDAIVMPGALQVLRRALVDDPRLGVVAPFVYGSDGRTMQVDSHGVFPTLGSILLRTNRTPPEARQPDWVSGVAMMLRRSDFQELGGFDPEFVMYLEDVDLCRRVRAAGQQVARVPGAAVRHLGGASRRSTADQRRQYGRSQRLYFEKVRSGRLTMAAVQAASVVRRFASRR